MWNIEYSSLCYTVGPCWLSTLYLMAINNISMQYFKMSKVMQNHPRLLNKVHQWWSHADLPWSLKQKEKSLKWILFYPHNLIKSGRTFDQYNQGASTKHLKNALQKGQEDQGDQKARRSNQTPNIHWKEWCWSRSSDNLATWCKEPTHWKRPWCWERLRVGGEGGYRGWDGWINMNWGKLWEMLKDREAWCVHGVSKSLTWLSDWTTCVRLK